VKTAQQQTPHNEAVNALMSANMPPGTAWSVHYLYGFQWHAEAKMPPDYGSRHFSACAGTELNAAKALVEQVAAWWKTVDVMEPVCGT
jgi:hypothetical protein